MNSSCPTCPSGARAGLSVNASWFNGITFIINPEWATNSQMLLDNPNGFDAIGVMTTAQCTSHSGQWFCTLSTSNSMAWGFGVAQGPITGTGEYGVQIVLFASHGSPTTLFSVKHVQYAYPSGCPTGSYYERSRSPMGTGVERNDACFDFRSFSASLAWAP